MKNTFLLSVAFVFIMLFNSCEEDKQYEFDISYHATFSEIQGVWRNSRNAFYTDIYIDGNTYHLEVTNAFNIDPFQMEDGDFLFVDDLMTLYPYEGSSDYGQFTVFWADALHSRLVIMPFGDFVPYTPPVKNPENPDEESQEGAEELN